MKRVGLTIVCLCLLVMPVRAQFIGPEALGGAAFGAFFGSLAGADCHGLSGTGAAIGAGVGFLAGAAIGAANQRAYRAYYVEPVPVAQPGYGYVYTSPVVAAAPVVYSPPPPPAPRVKAKPKKPSKVSVKKYSPPARVVPQIPDAPRVPDAPTF